MSTTAAATTVEATGAESRVAHKWAGWLHNPCRLGVPTASERGAESEVAHKWAGWLHNPCRLGVPTASERGAESEVAHKWARWLHKPCLRAPHRFRAGGRIRSGPQVGRVATYPCCPGVPTAGGRISSGSSQKWKILFFGGHATKRRLRVPNPNSRGHTTKRGFQSGATISEIAHKWAQWQSEVEKLIFWVSNLLSKKFFFSTK